MWPNEYHLFSSDPTGGSERAFSGAAQAARSHRPTRNDISPSLFLPEHTRLLQNYPNPFNPETWIPFELNQDSEVSLTIYDMAGRLVWRLDLGFQEAGAYLRRDRAIYWDGRTNTGERVASGTYFYTLKTEGYVSTQKMIILK